MIKGKKIILGVTGSISAFKAALLIRLLVKEEAEVQVIMSSAAKEFISPLTLSTLSKRPVLSEFTKGTQGEWNNHVELGLWADVMLIAPASANTLAKCANGICDNLLIATYLSAKCPVVFAPAMDLDMYQHRSNQNNIESLLSFGNHIIEAESGELASGLIGPGRLAEPENILEDLKVILSPVDILRNKRVLITAGPTQEAIDPVRFISNHSSGKMAYALARSFRNAGSKVHLVSGPVDLKEPFGVEMTPIQTAQEMFEKSANLVDKVDIVLFVAAVADFRPKKIAKNKIKKVGSELLLELEKTVDIAEVLGGNKKENQIFIGFALETENSEQNAILKIKKKNLDLIVLNSLQDKGAGFRYDTNKIKILNKSGDWKNFELKNKDEVAVDIMNEIKILLENREK